MSNSISQAVLKQRKQPHMTSLQACTRLVAMVTVLCVIILTLPLPEAKWAAECVTVCVCTSMCVCVCADQRVWPAFSQTYSIFLQYKHWLVGLGNDLVANYDIYRQYAWKLLLQLTLGFIMVRMTYSIRNVWHSVYVINSLTTNAGCAFLRFWDVFF